MSNVKTCESMYLSVKALNKTTLLTWTAGIPMRAAYLNVFEYHTQTEFAYIWLQLRWKSCIDYYTILSELTILHFSHIASYIIL